MSSHIPDEERIFHVAREIGNVEARSEYLDQVCAGDQVLRERVEDLLRVHEQEQSFLKSNGDPPPTEAIGKLNMTPGRQIGRYKLLQRIGEGGFGVVFMAEQSRPVRRKVALKVIKPGMDSQAVVARFEAERQALAMMDHPNIARVLDGGATESGRPYFVMELVKGVPITEYCDQNQLSTDDRLGLFVNVCQAVRHAHQKGIIHRDLKPSNILVTLHDGKPIIKVIDFGVAKAINQELTEKTLFTAFGQMVGTPLYMSPEQAEISGLDVDTRSDVYSLGVLLYELLTGSTPLQSEQLREAGYAEIQRLVKESEPLKPSTRLSTAGERLTAIAKHRSISPDRLPAMVRGDLDWVVMKSLEKDRARRYQSADRFAEDVARHLADEPVEARPPTLRYLASRYVRRNRVPLAVTAMLITLLAGGLVGTISQMFVAWENEKRASVAEEKAEETIQDSHPLLIERCFLKSIGGEFQEAQTTLDLARRANVRADWLYTMKGAIAFHQGDWPSAIAELKHAREENPRNVSALALLANAYVYNGDWHRWAQIADDVDRAEPGTEYRAFDQLFLGYAFFYMNYERAAESIQEVIVEHPSWLIPRYVWAGAIAHEAKRLKGKDNEHAKRLIHRALTEVQPSPGLEAEEALIESPYISAIKLFIYDMAYDQLEGLPKPDRDAIAKEGNKLAGRLAESPQYAIGGVLREWHYGLVDGENRSAQLQLARKSIMEHGRGWLLNSPIAELAKAEDFDVIFDLEGRGPEVEFNKALVRIIRNEGEDKQHALDTYHKMKNDYPTWYMRSLLVEIPLLAGERNLAVGDAKKWLDEMPKSEVAGFPSRVRCEREKLSWIADLDAAGPYPFNDEPYDLYQKTLLEGVCAFGQSDWKQAVELLSELENMGRVNNRFYWAKVLLARAKKRLAKEQTSLRRRFD